MIGEGREARGGGGREIRERGGEGRSASCCLHTLPWPTHIREGNQFICLHALAWHIFAP